MNQIKKQKHINAFLTNFELACELAIIITTADLIWLLHDILQNGLSIVYSLIGILLIIGLVGTSFVVYRHHNHYTKKSIKKYYKQRRKKKAKKNLELKEERPEVICLDKV